MTILGFMLSASQVCLVIQRYGDQDCMHSSKDVRSCGIFGIMQNSLTFSCLLASVYM